MKANMEHKMTVSEWYDAFDAWCTKPTLVARQHAAHEFDALCGIAPCKDAHDDDSFWFEIRDAKKFAIACIKWGWSYT